MLEIENQPLLTSDLYDPSYFRRAPWGMEKPRLRKVGKRWWCSGHSLGCLSAAASGKDPHEAYAKCMGMLGFVVPMQLPKFEPPALADAPEGDRFGNVLNFQTLP